MSSSSSGGSGGAGYKKGSGEGGGSIAERDEVDVEQLVREVVESFEGGSSLVLTPAARSAVLQPAIEHRTRIMAELSAGTVQPQQIQAAVATLLANAEGIARQRNAREIDEAIVELAMRLECRYFPWC